MNGRSGRNRLVGGLKAGLLTIGLVFLVTVGQTSEVEVQPPPFVDHTAETWQFGQVRGVNTSDIGVYGWTETPQHVAVYGQNAAGTGVKGVGKGGDGVQGFTTVPTATGVLGYSYVAPGTTGWSSGNDGLVGITTSTDPDHAAVRARNEGSGPAIVCEGDLVVTGEIQAEEDFGSCSQVASVVEDLSDFVTGSLAPDVSSILDAVTTIRDDCCIPQESLELLPGPFPSEGGARFRAFLTAARAVIRTAAEDLPGIQPEDASQQRLLETASDVVLSVEPELAQLESVLTDLDPAYQAHVDTYVPTGVTEFLGSVVTIDPARMSPKVRSALDGIGAVTIEDVFKKLAEATTGIPYVGPSIKVLIEDIIAACGVVTEVFGVVELQCMVELEWKLDALLRGLFGTDIPPTATEEEVWELTQGVQNVSEPAGALAKLEQKLCSLASLLDVLDQRLSYALFGVNKRWNETEFPRLSLCYGEDTGLVWPTGEPAESTQLIKDLAFPRVMTTPSISDWLIKLESLVQSCSQRATSSNGEGTGTETSSQSGEVGDASSGGTPITISWRDLEDGENLMLPLVKKIYVYDEGTFLAENQDDAYEVLIETPAFDVSGWVDLTSLRAGDSVSITVEVSVGDGPFRTWTRTAFSGVQERGLKHFTEFTENLEQFVGTKVRVTLRQDASQDGFEEMIPVHYQFIVESQT